MPTPPRDDGGTPGGGRQRLLSSDRCLRPGALEEYRGCIISCSKIVGEEKSYTLDETKERRTSKCTIQKIMIYIIKIHIQR